MNDRKINEAIETGLFKCLKSLQKTNPSIIMTSNDIKRTERDSRYVPAVAAGLASIVVNSYNDDFKRNAMKNILSWKETDCQLKHHQKDKKNHSSMLDFPKEKISQNNISSNDITNKLMLSFIEKDFCKVQILGPLLEERLRCSLSLSTETKKNHHKKDISNVSKDLNRNDRKEETVIASDSNTRILEDESLNETKRKNMQEPKNNKDDDSDVPSVIQTINPQPDEKILQEYERDVSLDDFFEDSCEQNFHESIENDKECKESTTDSFSDDLSTNNDSFLGSDVFKLNSRTRNLNFEEQSIDFEENSWC